MEGKGPSPLGTIVLTITVTEHENNNYCSTWDTNPTLQVESLGSEPLYHLAFQKWTFILLHNVSCSVKMFVVMSRISVRSS